jgi:hypothetical protein
VAHLIFLEIFPAIAGIIVFIFFLISSSFIVYGVIRHIYTDHMLPRKRKSNELYETIRINLFVKLGKVLKKLGKLPEERKRKHYRKRHTNHQLSNHTIAQRTPTAPTIATSQNSSASNIRQPKATQNPYYLDEYSNASDDSVGLKQVLSYTTPPMKVEKKVPPTVPRLIKIPGEPFPTLPDAPLSSKEASAVRNIAK